MQNIPLTSGFCVVAQGDLRAQCEAAAHEIGAAMGDRLKAAGIPGWTVSHTVTECPDTGSDVMLEVSAHDEDASRQFNFRAGFDFPAGLSWIENYSVLEQRGTGLGRDVFSVYLDQAAEKGIKKANLTSTSVGSYFWITQGFAPSQPAGLTSKIDLRLDVLEQWLPENSIAAARAQLELVKNDPAKLRELAQLDFRAEIAKSFSGGQYQIDMMRMASEGWTEGFLDEVRAEISMTTQGRGEDQPTKLGHLLLVNTRWSGSLALPPRNG